MGNLCPRTPPQNFLNSLQTPHSRSDLPKPLQHPRLTVAKFYPVLLKKWLGLLTFEVRSPKGPLEISFSNRLRP